MRINIVCGFLLATWIISSPAMAQYTPNNIVPNIENMFPPPLLPNPPMMIPMYSPYPIAIPVWIPVIFISPIENIEQNHGSSKQWRSKNSRKTRSVVCDPQKAYDLQTGCKP